MRQSQNNNPQPDFGWERIAFNAEENKRVWRRGRMIVYVIAAIFVFGCLLGAYFGYFAALVGAR